MNYNVFIGRRNIGRKEFYLIRYVVCVLYNGPSTEYAEYSGVRHKTKREAMHELAVAKTDRSVSRAWIDEREVIYRDNS